MSQLGRLVVQAVRTALGTATTALARLASRGREPSLCVLRPGDAPRFPDPRTLGSSGLVAIGGDLSVERLLAAYEAGIFPWFDEDSDILWWSPNPRGIFELDGLHISRRLARTIRSGRYRVTFDEAFSRVIRGCASRAEGTWITAGILEAYETLHRLGHAHSVEVWMGDELAGGIYGVTRGGLFAGESMFSARRDASKIALVHLMQHLRRRGYTLFDIQMTTEHTASLGAIEIPREEYLRRLEAAVALPVQFG